MNIHNVEIQPTRRNPARGWVFDPFRTRLHEGEKAASMNSRASSQAMPDGDHACDRGIEASVGEALMLSRSKPASHFEPAGGLHISAMCPRGMRVANTIIIQEPDQPARPSQNASALSLRKRLAFPRARDKIRNVLRVAGFAYFLRTTRSSLAVRPHVGKLIYSVISLMFAGSPRA